MTLRSGLGNPVSFGANFWNACSLIIHYLIFLFKIGSKYLNLGPLGPFDWKRCFFKISNCLLWPPCHSINLKITELVDLINMYLHTKFGRNPTFRLTVMKCQNLNFEHSSWQPCSFFGKNRPRRLTFIFKDVCILLKTWSKNTKVDIFYYGALFDQVTKHYISSKLAIRLTWNFHQL